MRLWRNGGNNRSDQAIWGLVGHNNFLTYKHSDVICKQLLFVQEIRVHSPYVKCICDVNQGCKVSYLTKFIVHSTMHPRYHGWCISWLNKSDGNFL